MFNLIIELAKYMEVRQYMIIRMLRFVAKRVAKNTPTGTNIRLTPEL